MSSIGKVSRWLNSEIEACNDDLEILEADGSTEQTQRLAVRLAAFEEVRQEIMSAVYEEAAEEDRERSGRGEQ